ncbi:MAG: heavy metal-associated domain-containing protein, partial [Oscillibacter sp.]
MIFPSVEKVTRKLPGVERSEVNLTTGILTISYDEAQVGPVDILQKVEKAGFGATLHPPKGTAKKSEEPLDAQALALKRQRAELAA